MKIQGDKIKEQDEALDELHNLLKSTTGANRKIQNELEAQNPMLKNMDSQMDKVNSKMKKAQNRLESYVEKSSNSCLMTIICVQILIFLLLISVF
jgi:predicted Zn-dependent protease